MSSGSIARATISTTEAEPIFEEFDDKVMLAKPVSVWSRRNRRTVALTWNSIHPKAKDYLTTQSADSERTKVGIAAARTK
jgi:hypothetical protein